MGSVGGFFAVSCLMLTGALDVGGGAGLVAGGFVVVGFVFDAFGSFFWVLAGFVGAF